MNKLTKFKRIFCKHKYKSKNMPKMFGFAHCGIIYFKCEKCGKIKKERELMKKYKNICFDTRTPQNDEVRE